jgi:hypothetical protein
MKYIKTVDLRKKDVAEITDPKSSFGYLYGTVWVEATIGELLD